jgi:nucleotide-binding universal stress UspA family protein
MTTAPFRRILVATDGSATCERAIDVAVGLAGSIGAELIAVSVVPEGAAPADLDSASDPVGAAEAAAMALRYRDPDDEAAAGIRCAQAAADQATAAGVVGRWVTWGGCPEDGILAAADELAADIIVVGSHARGTVTRKLLGSVSDQVVRRAKVPVLVVRP